MSSPFPCKRIMTGRKLTTRKKQIGNLFRKKTKPLNARECYQQTEKYSYYAEVEFTALLNNETRLCVKYL